MVGEDVLQAIPHRVLQAPSGEGLEDLPVGLGLGAEAVRGDKVVSIERGREVVIRMSSWRTVPAGSGVGEGLLLLGEQALVGVLEVGGVSNSNSAVRRGPGTSVAEEAAP